MKKIIITTLLIIFIPYLIVTLFVKDKSAKFFVASNTFVRVLNQETNTVSKVPLEEYVKGVVAGEMPASFDIEALKAQAVASRSYVLKKMNDNKNNSYDVVDTIKNQVYLSDDRLKNRWGTNYESYNNKVKEAVFTTKGKYIAYDGKVIDALFFSTSNGKTENSEDVFLNAVPYLRSVDSSWDTISPAFNSSKEISLSDFYSRLNLPYNPTLNVKILSITNSGAIKKLSINNVSFESYTVRDKLGLKSTSFNITQNGSNIIFTTKGYGHGVGMSQYGAQGMAHQGYNYSDIIKHYYQGVEILNL